MAGGVGFYIKNDLSYTICSDLTISRKDFEAMWIEIANLRGSNVICGVIYRHPHGDLDSFVEYLNVGLERMNQHNKICIIMGDFNIDLLKSDTHSDKFLNVLSSNFFQPHILQPTRITDHSATLIGNIFLNSLEHLVISGNIVYDLTDHLPNFLIMDKFTTLPQKVNLYKRDFSTFNSANLVNDIQNIDWDATFHSERDLSIIFNKFYSCITEIIDKHIPLKLLSRRQQKFSIKPWITPAIQKSIQIKNRYYTKFLKTKSIYFQNKFKLYRNKLNH